MKLDFKINYDQVNLLPKKMTEAIGKRLELLALVGKDAILTAMPGKDDKNIVRSVTARYFKTTKRIEFNLSAFTKPIPRSSGTLVRKKRKSGKQGPTKQVPVRAAKKFNILEAWLEGTGIYGLTGSPIRPVAAKFLIVPIKAIPANRDVLYINGQAYTWVKSVKGQRKKPFLDQALRQVSYYADLVFSDFIQ